MQGAAASAGSSSTSCKTGPQACTLAPLRHRAASYQQIDAIRPPAGHPAAGYLQANPPSPSGNGHARKSRQCGRSCGDWQVPHCNGNRLNQQQWAHTGTSLGTAPRLRPDSALPTANGHAGRAQRPAPRQPAGRHRGQVCNARERPRMRCRRDAAPRCARPILGQITPEVGAHGMRKRVAPLWRRPCMATHPTRVGEGM